MKKVNIREFPQPQLEITFSRLQQACYQPFNLISGDQGVIYLNKVAVQEESHSSYDNHDHDAGSNSHTLTENNRDQGATHIAGYYFDDGVRRTDFVIVWQLPLSQQQVSQSACYKRQQAFRDEYVENLLSLGVELEKAVVATTSYEMHYLKVHIPWHLMCTYAEILKLRVPIKTHFRSEPNWSAKALSRLRLPNFMLCPVAYKTPEVSSCLFSSNKIHTLVGLWERVCFDARVQVSWSRESGEVKPQVSARRRPRPGYLDWRGVQRHH
ncbi:Anoctamin-7 [Cichlidogyrus casuarinus]|uniref:Anoctamin-7 n=1 Tax=Cichlidogyrus casuarinus TaxID=1844966 RepID=A0ABD2PVY9_9PLAT